MLTKRPDYFTSVFRPRPSKPLPSAGFFPRGFTHEPREISPIKIRHLVGRATRTPWLLWNDYFVCNNISRYCLLSSLATLRNRTFNERTPWVNNWKLRRETSLVWILLKRKGARHRYFPLESVLFRQQRCYRGRYVRLLVGGPAALSPGNFTTGVITILSPKEYQDETEENDFVPELVALLCESRQSGRRREPRYYQFVIFVSIVANDPAWPLSECRPSFQPFYRLGEGGTTPPCGRASADAALWSRGRECSAFGEAGIYLASGECTR